MKDIESAQLLCEFMIDGGMKMGKKVVALLSEMNQPLGYYEGNSFEIKEAVQTLKGDSPDDLTELSLTLGAVMLILANKVDSIENG